MQEKSKPNQVDWEKHIEECERENESQKQYCKKQGLNYATFAYWRAKRKSKSTDVGLDSFSEVKIKPDSCAKIKPQSAMKPQPPRSI